MQAVTVGQIATGVALGSANGSANVLVGPGSANVLVGMRLRCQWQAVTGFIIGFLIRYADEDVGAPWEKSPPFTYWKTFAQGRGPALSRW